MSTQGTGMKFDAGKLRWSLLTRDLSDELQQIVTVLEYGATKYSPNSWQSVPNARRRYEDALERHLHAWRNGEGCDKESGLPHLSHIACNVLFLMHLYGEQHEKDSKGNPQYY